MADEITKVIKIDVSGAVESLDAMKKKAEESGYSFKSLKDAKQYIDALRASLIDLEEGSDEYAERVKEIDTVQEKLNSAMKATGSTIKNAEGSYNALSKKMSELKKAWKETNDEAERKVLGKQIVEINDKLKGMDSSIGNYQRNVGNYEKAFTTGLNNIISGLSGMGGPLGAATAGVKGLSTAFKSLLANPIGAFLTLIVTVLGALKKGFAGSEEASNSLKRAFSSLQPVVDAISNVFTGFAKIVGNIAEKVIPALVNGVQTAEKKIVELLNRLGIVSDEKMQQFNDAIQAQKDAVDETRRLTEEEIRLTERKRQFLVDEAKAQRDVSELRERASDKEKYSAAERQRFLQNAIDIEKSIYSQKLRIAKDEYQLAKDRAALTDNNAEDNQKLAEAEANLYRVQAEVADKLRGLNKEKIKTNKELQGSYDDTAKKVEEINERIKMSHMNEMEQEVYILTKKYNEEKKLFEEGSAGMLALTEEYNANLIKIFNKQKDEIVNLNKRNKDALRPSYEVDIEALKESYSKELAVITKFYDDVINVAEEGSDARMQLEKEKEESITNLTAYYNSKRNEIVIDQYEKSLDALDLWNAYEKQAAEESLNTEYEKQQKWYELEDKRLQKTKETYEAILALDDLSVEARDEYKTKLNQIDLEIEANQHEMVENQKEHVLELVDTYNQAVQGIGSLMGSIADIMEEDIKRRQKNGEISEEQAEKEFENVKKVQIAQAIINGLAGMATAISTAMQLGPIAGPIVGGINAAAVIASTAAQVAKIRNTSIGSGGSVSSSDTSSSGAAAPAAAAMAYSPSYSTNVTGESDTVNLANAVTAGTNDQRVYVVESDINQVGRRVQVRDNESTF